ncbi:hypothetical protein LCGC14_2118140 [marine sediment metagenome]|uniref:Uncharacterized protein n=1 Tax=marine sediment metagenome TaxID=412755 RepID=A0A0F9ES50_9ZZZZ
MFVKAHWQKQGTTTTFDCESVSVIPTKDGTGNFTVLMQPSGGRLFINKKDKPSVYFMNNQGDTIECLCSHINN